MTDAPSRLSAPLFNALERVRVLVDDDARLAGLAVVGSYAAGIADEHSDLDLFVFIADEHGAGFLTERDAFIRRIGDPAFLADFGHDNRAFVVLADGAELEFTFLAVSDAADHFFGPARVLIDKTGALGDGPTALLPSAADPEERRRYAQQLMEGFWHDFGHLTTALARGHLWWAHGQLGVLGGYCLNLARLKRDLLDPEAGDEPYWKADAQLPADTLAGFEPTLHSLDIPSMRSAGRELASLYRATSTELCRQHGLQYPAVLEAVLLARFERGAG